MMTTMNTRIVISPPIAAVTSFLIDGPHDAADAGERGAGDEHADEQPADAIAQRLHHFAVLDAGAHQQADARAVQHQVQRREDREAERHRHQPVHLDRRAADDEAAAQHCGLGQRQRRRRPTAR